MAGIGFELRKLFNKQGLVNHVKAYAYSSMTITGPMILCMLLIVLQQRMMNKYGSSYLQWELYVASVQYCFIFSILLTSGISMVMTRYVADQLYQRKYDRLLSSYYGSLIVSLPIAAVIAWLFLSGVTASAAFKFAAYIFFMALIVVWLQAIYLSALKDYIRIFRSFGIGVGISLLVGWLLMRFTDVDLTLSAMIAMDVGFLSIALMSNMHFEHVFPPRKQELMFEFLTYLKKYPALFVIGTLMYLGIYIHSFVYWLGEQGDVIADQFRISPLFDLPVFFAFVTVVPTLITFVVSVETKFYEKFRAYYKQVLQGGTWQQIDNAKKEMRTSLIQEISFLMEVQLLFTIVSIAVGMKLLPQIGFTMEQVHTFLMLVLGYFFFIIMLELILLLLYFDDQKGALLSSAVFVLLNVGLTYWTMIEGYDGLGMFYASFVGLVVVLARLLYVLRNIDYYTFCSQPMHAHKNTSKLKRKSKKTASTVLLGVLLIITLTACTSTEGDVASPDSNVPQAVTKSNNDPIVSQPTLTEDKRIYTQDEDGSLKTLYVTILPGSEKKQQQGLSWYGLNREISKFRDESLEVIVQEGDEDGSGPKPGMFGFGQEQANAKVSIRGNTNRYASQKSYKLRLFDDAGQWLDQRTINLNKHSFDRTRVSNKLSFDLIEAIPNMTSLRTQFVHLYVKDMSEPGAAGVYEDYGLFTHVEQPNEKFLKSHWLDPYGQLYKANNFEFLRYADKLKLETDPEYDKQAFESVLEIRGREEHAKLLAMLDDVTNTNLSIDQVVEEHFDLDNLLTWLAMNILIDNDDTNSQNFYLYSPLNSNKWYFLPWDYDAGWKLEERFDPDNSFQQGISNYWGMRLFNRYFRSVEHVQQLQDKVDELHDRYINASTVKRQTEQYEPIVQKFVNQAPDTNFLPGTVAEVQENTDKMVSVPQKAIKLFLEDIQKPKPFYMNSATERVDVGHRFNWDISYDLQGDDLTYDFSLATDANFTDMVAEKKGLLDPEIVIPNLKAGIYYWRVTAHDSAGHKQVSFDYYVDEEGIRYNGIMEIEVE